MANLLSNLKVEQVIGLPHGTKVYRPRINVNTDTGKCSVVYEELRVQDCEPRYKGDRTRSIFWYSKVHADWRRFNMSVGNSLYLTLDEAVNRVEKALAIIKANVAAMTG